MSLCGFLEVLILINPMMRIQKKRLPYRQIVDGHHPIIIMIVSTYIILFMGMFHMITFIFGLGAAVLVGKAAIYAMDPGGNLATPMLARFVAGGEGSFTGELFMAFIVSIAFITVIATVSGLCIAASTAFSYDFWFKVVKNGIQDHLGQIKTARISAIAIGILAIICSLALKHMNVAYLSGLAFSIAATVNLPTIILALYWKRLTTTGALIGIIGGSGVPGRVCRRGQNGRQQRGQAAQRQKQREQSSHARSSKSPMGMVIEKRNIL